ncbi:MULTISPECIES: hypothetical protein [unclassified Amycolatopsis]|uniref:hypothetical protein n=1 Tax=unclassified Amycolatopsis TaxID=2618356 RepID=UPI001FF5B0A3|nr:MULTISPECIES: hypothetical protein [unclassified Amycolatopsis]UOZ05432.1 hypothetical protein MUY22_42465 [Amycolatopsis sp. WQ 127309]WSJ81023.1 hypothetical protein OG439_19085 [Amycolatopsis sp. NBC_01307]WSK75554.1 hypothetical protein OG570_29775 [Amycolatopsis sp. NBC_01286]
MSSKTAVVVLSDPSTGTDEALGRVFDALATAWEFAQGGEALVLFQGTGTRWPAVLADPAHPAHELYTAVKKQVATVASSGCTTVFGATAGIEAEEIKQIGQNQAPGTPGVASIRELVESGYQVLTF